jgi:hypothetical protein
MQLKGCTFTSSIDRPLTIRHGATTATATLTKGNAWTYTP